MPDLPVDDYPAPGTLDDVLGFEIVEANEEVVRGRFAVERRVQQPLGLVHGGAYASFAESMASAATFQLVNADGGGQIAMGQANATSFMRPITKGTVHAEARPLHRGRTSWIWDVEFRDDDGRLAAITRMTIAVRPAPGGASHEGGGPHEGGGASHEGGAPPEAGGSPPASG